MPVLEGASDEVTVSQLTNRRARNLGSADDPAQLESNWMEVMRRLLAATREGE